MANENDSFVDRWYTRRLRNDSTFLSAITIHYGLHILDWVGTAGMIQTHGIAAEANVLAQRLYEHGADFGYIKLVIVPFTIALLGTFAFMSFKDRYEEEGVCEGWAERVVMLLQALNTVYTGAFIVIVLANIYRG